MSKQVSCLVSCNAKGAVDYPSNKQFEISLMKTHCLLNKRLDYVVRLFYINTYILNIDIYNISHNKCVQHKKRELESIHK